MKAKDTIGTFLEIEGAFNNGNEIGGAFQKQLSSINRQYRVFLVLSRWFWVLPGIIRYIAGNYYGVLPGSDSRVFLNRV